MEYIKVQRMSGLNRVCHWLMVIAFITCAITGFYIAHPFLVFETGEVVDSYFMGYVRLAHFFGAIGLDVILLIWIYLFFFGDNPYFKSIFPIGQRLKEAVQMLKHYITLDMKDRPEMSEKMDALNAWGLFLFIIVFKFLMLTTGFAMFSAQINASNTSIPGGQYMFYAFGFLAQFLFGDLVSIRTAHHLMAWLMIFFVINHIYLEIWRDNFWKESDISIVFSGYKFIKKDK